jgi:hypothetical protein
MKITAGLSMDMSNVLICASNLLSSSSHLGNSATMPRCAKSATMETRSERTSADAALAPTKRQTTGTRRPDASASATACAIRADLPSPEGPKRTKG